MTPPLSIRRATLDDAPLLSAGNVTMAHETEGLTLDPSRALRGVRAVFEDPSRGFYLLAERGGAVVGQLMVTYEWSDWRDGVFWWIQSVYVTPEARRAGVYRALYASLLEQARSDDGVCGVRLYVHHDNDIATRTYRALGMDAAAYQLFEVDFVIARTPSS